MRRLKKLNFLFSAYIRLPASFETLYMGNPGSEDGELRLLGVDVHPPIATSPDLDPISQMHEVNHAYPQALSPQWPHHLHPAHLLLSRLEDSSHLSLLPYSLKKIRKENCYSDSSRHWYFSNREPCAVHVDASAYKVFQLFHGGEEQGHGVIL